MPKGYPPTVFVSSTCYDLNQVRTDMKSFLESIGTEPLLSEHPEFPVNPESKTIENCVSAVKERADIFVLIVGSRYGSTNESGKSITNLEYLAAKSKGIPIYVFVSEHVIHVLPIWKKNPGADYSDAVDTPKLFEFVDSLRSSGDHWVFHFEKAQHIIETLRHQFGILFMDGLAVRRQYRDAELPPDLATLSGRSLRLSAEKPDGWEFLLFASVLSDSISESKPLKLDLAYQLTLGRPTSVGEPHETFMWISAQCHKMLLLTGSFDKLINITFPEAVGPPGQSGNPQLIAYAARRTGAVYKSALEWAIEFNLVEVDPEFKKVLHLISDSSKELTSKLEGFPSLIESEVNKTLSEKAVGKEYVANLKLTLSNFLPMEELEAEMARLRHMYSP